MNVAELLAFQVILCFVGVLEISVKSLSMLNYLLFEYGNVSFLSLYKKKSTTLTIKYHHWVSM